MKLLILLFISVFIFEFGNACTSIIISGKFTTDGRPILWKNRDTDNLNNKLMFFKDGKFPYIGLINSNDSLGKEVWVGINGSGFSIMNTASYNLDYDVKIKNMDQEGVLMKLALRKCITVEDFEQLLKSMKKPLGVEANFGVIDAQGGAAFFEVNNYSYKKLDVNDPSVASFGYLIHTNFSFTGKFKDGMGYIRYIAAENIFSQAALTNQLNVKFILQNVSRSLKHGLTKVDLRKYEKFDVENPEFFWFTDFIPRTSTAASVAIQGVKPSENPLLTTMWTILGFPLTSVVFPVWISEKVNLPEILTAPRNQTALLCDQALYLKSKCFPMNIENGKNYIYLPALFNFSPQLQSTENKVFVNSNTFLENCRKQNSISETELEKLYKLNSETIESMMTSF